MTSSPLWFVRVAWLVQPLAFVPLLEAATSSLPTAGRVVVAVAGWTVWAVLLLMTFVPTTLSMTVGRLVSPAVVAAALVAGLFGSSVEGWRFALATAFAIVATMIWFSGDVGIELVQGSAYGAERRFPLKAPVGQYAPIATTWAALAATALTAVVVLANELWIVGVLLLAAAAAGGWFLGPRFHLMSRRWLVVVPVGVVIHDPLLLVENALFRTPTVSSMHLAPTATEAADLTGGTPGVAIEIVLHDVDTIVKAAGPQHPRGIAIHVRSVLVAPTRPGRALVEAAQTRLPVR